MKYERIEIKTEADLPKEQGNYFVYTTGGTSMTTFYGVELTSKWWINNVAWYLQPLPESEPQKAGMPTETLKQKVSCIISNEKTTGNEKRDAILELFSSRLSVPEVNPISDEALQTYFWDHQIKSFGVMNEAQAIAMVKHFLPEAEAKVSDEDIENYARSMGNPASESDFERGQWFGIKYGAIAMRDGKIGHSGTEPDNQTKKQ